MRTAAMVLRQLRERLEQDEQDRDSSAGFDV
jgi:hypothetical protein